MPKIIEGEGYREFSEPRFFEAETLSDIAKIRNPVDKAHAIIAGAGFFEAWKFDREASDSDDGFSVLESLNPGITGKWRRATGGEVSVKLFGATGNGTTEDTTYFEDAVQAVPEGTVIYVPDGTYLLDNVDVSRDVSFKLSRHAVLKMKPNAAGHMLDYTDNATGYIEGGTFDGNKDNQAGAVWYSTLKVKTDDHLQIRNVTFQNFTFSGLKVEETTGVIEVFHCWFLNGKEHGGTLNDQLSTGIHYSTIIQDARPFLRVKYCRFIQDEGPSATGKNPGGIIVNGSEVTNSHPSVDLSNNFFKNIGQDHAGNHIGGIDLYEDVIGATVNDNNFVNSRYVPLKLQNSGMVVCRGNLLKNTESTAITFNIWYDPAQRIQATAYEDCIISENIVDDPYGTLGILVQGVNDPGRRVTIRGNHIKGVLEGIRINTATAATTEMDEPLLISENQVTSTGAGGYGIRLIGVLGHIRLSNNYVKVSAQTAFIATDRATEAIIHLNGNHFETDAENLYALAVDSPAGLLCESGVYMNTFSGEVAVNVTGTIAEFQFPSDTNFVKEGSTSITFTNIGRVIGTVSYGVDPEGTVAAQVGTRFIRTGSPFGQYVKTSGTAKTGWRVVPQGDGGLVVSGDYAADFSDRCLSVDATATGRTITLPPVATAVGLEITIGKRDASGNTVTIQPSGAETLNGGNVTLTTQFEVAKFFCINSEWWRIV